MAGQVLQLQGPGERDDSTPDDEERGLEVRLIQVLEEVGGVVRGAIVIRQSPGHLIRAVSHI